MEAVTGSINGVEGGKGDSWQGREDAEVEGTGGQGQADASVWQRAGLGGRVGVVHPALLGQLEVRLRLSPSPRGSPSLSHRGGDWAPSRH